MTHPGSNLLKKIMWFCLFVFFAAQGLSGPQGESGPDGPQGNKVGPCWNNLELHHDAHLLRL